MTSKIVFLLGFSCNQNAIKRINEFVERGYDVSAYGFMRDGKNDIHPENVNVKIIGEYSNTVPYKNRISILLKGIRSVVNNYKNQNVLFYSFGLDVTSLFRLICNKPYIYEEEDLIYTYFGSKIVVKLFNKIDKHIVNHSLLTVFTSEGFAQYHFGENVPDNIVIIPNKLKKEVLTYKPELSKIDLNHLKIGFVGSFRFQSVYNFAKIFSELYPIHEFHFYGGTSNVEDEQLFKPLEVIPNCIFHGRFKNPQGLPDVYSNIDLLLSTYDVRYENVKYAEPNKIYEAIYFETPIIATRGTFLADKILKLGIGYDVDPLDKDDIIRLITGLTVESYNNKINNIRKLPTNFTIDNYNEFFEKLNQYTI